MSKETTNKLVSIIMPLHNSAKFMKEAIESVLAQTYSNWELLIIDDASVDDSLQIAKKYEEIDPRIQVLVNKQSIGIPSVPRNIGIKAAKGRFIAFLDSDDIYFPHKLEQQLPHFNNNKIAVVYANYEKMEEDGTRSNRIVHAPSKINYKALLKGNVITMPAGMYDREKVGTIFLKDKHHEDYIMWLEILNRGFEAISTGTTVAAVRVRSSSVSSNKLKTICWQWNVYRDVEKLPLIQSSYYFVHYAIKAIRKSII